MNAEFPMVGAALVDYRRAADAMDQAVDRAIEAVDQVDEAEAKAIGGARLVLGEAIAACDAVLAKLGGAHARQ